MNTRLPDTRRQAKRSRVILASLAALTVLALSTAADTFAQHRFSRTYPARNNIRLQLTNWSGGVTVEGWDRDEVKIIAQMDSAATRFAPAMNGDSLVIDVVHDNHGRGDVGDINFEIRVPVNSTVDIETRRGNITVRGVQGSLVRAHVSSEGDIELTGIRAANVMAENKVGDILFDGELRSGGTYRLSSAQGNISIRIPENSSFRLMALAPMTRRIDLGSFANAGLKFIGDQRKVVGEVGGDNRALLNISNLRGTITFIRH